MKRFQNGIYGGVVIMHYYQFNIGDYRRDTSHLSRIEHGIYRELIDWYYLDESPIPLETQSVMRRLRLVSDEDAKALQNVLSDFFVKSDGWHHARIDQDILDYHATCDKNKANGKLGGRPKKTHSVSSGLPDESQNNPNQEPITNNQVVNPLVPSLPADDVPKAKSDSFPDCPHQEIIDLYGEILPELPQPRIWEGTNQSALRARWRWALDDLKRKGKAHDKAAGLDFFKRMFAYVKESDFLCGRGSTWGGADLGWIVKGANFGKILSGNYENKAAA